MKRNKLLMSLLIVGLFISSNILAESWSIDEAKNMNNQIEDDLSSATYELSFSTATTSSAMTSSPAAPR